MIKQIKRTEPKSHSWPAEIFYKHQQAIRNEAFTSEIEPRTQLAGPCIRPEVLKLRIFKSTPVPFLAATRKKNNFLTSLTSSPPDLSKPYPLIPLPYPVFQGTTQLCLLGHHSWPANVFYKHQQTIRNEAFTSETTTRACPTHQSNSTPCVY